jgi:hypothetical protein
MSEQTLTYQQAMNQISTGGDHPQHTVINHTDTWPYYYQASWPTYYPDKTAQAFKIIKILMDKKIIKITNIKLFIDTVSQIAEVL